MNLFKRLTTTVTATIDGAVGQLENHDAIVDATIKQTRQSVARTKARINTLRQQESVYEQQLHEAREQMNLWESRARNLADSDQQKALDCLSRRNACEEQSTRLQQSIQQQRELVMQVSANLKTLETKLESMQHKYSLMRSRQTVADVNKATSKIDTEQNLAETFERWESLVLEHELNASDGLAVDRLEQELTKQESDEALLKQLSELSTDTAAPNQEKPHE